MGPAAKWEYMKKTYERYICADRKQKTKILDEFCATCECHRKSAIRLMIKGPPPERRSARRRRGATYRKRVIDRLESIWEVSGHLWSPDRLVACKKGNPRKVKELLKLRKQLDPIVLSKTIDAKLRRIWRMASKTPNPSTHRPGKITNYRDKPLSGPPDIPHSFPPLQRYERVWEREQRLGTV